MKPKNHSIAIWAIGLAMTYSACTTPQKWSEELKEGYVRVTQKGGATLGYAPSSGVKLIEDDGYVFKDLNRNGKLDKYEDWRLGFEERAIDMASQL